MNVFAVTMAVVNHTPALSGTPCADLGVCPLANFGRMNNSVMGLGIAHYAGIYEIADGNIGSGGCPCADGVLGLAGTPCVSLVGVADVCLGLSGAPRAGLDNTASCDLGLSGCPMADRDGRGISSMVTCSDTCSLMVGRGMSNLAASGYTFHLVDLPSG